MRQGDGEECGKVTFLHCRTIDSNDGCSGGTDAQMIALQVHCAGCLKRKANPLAIGIA